MPTSRGPESGSKGRKLTYSPFVRYRESITHREDVRGIQMLTAGSECFCRV